MQTDVNNSKHLIADEGKVLKRTIGYPLTGKEIFLGKVVIDGVSEDDVVDNYIEVEEEKPEETNEEQL